MKVTDLEDARSIVDAANASLGWYVGRPTLHDEMASHPWEQYAFDRTERPVVGARSREWTAVGRTEIECVREMARCLTEIAARRTPQ